MMTQDSKISWKERLDKASAPIQEYLKKLSAIRNKRRSERQFKDKLAVGDIRGEGKLKPIPPPERAVFQVARAIPQGIKIIEHTDKLVRLRFLAFRVGFLIYALPSAFLLFYLARFTNFLFDDWGDISFIKTAFVILASAVILAKLFPRVEVIVTAKWLKFGKSLYHMHDFNGISVSGTGSVQIRNTGSPILLKQFYVNYGRWGEATEYLTIDNSAVHFTKFINEIIEYVTADQSIHASELGEREQKF